MSRVLCSWPLVLIVVLAVVLVVACGGKSPTAPVTQPPVDVPLFTELFRGTIKQGENGVHLLVAANPGRLTMKLTELSPLATLTVGLGFGQPTDPANPSSCVLAATDTSVRGGEELVATIGAAGTYCVAVLDVGNIFAGVEVSYALSVTHP